MRFARVEASVVQEIIDLPEGVEPQSAFHQSLADHMHKCDEMTKPGWSYDGQKFIPPARVELGVVKATYTRAVDELAEAQRLRWITPGEGQALTYQRKVEEAKRAVLEAAPAAGDYPMLAASVGIDGDDVKAVGTLVLAMDAQWAVIGAAIERRRMSAKRDIQSAEDEEAILAIMAGITWPDAPE